jgi:hypothetical protein
MALEHLKTPQNLALNKWASRRIYEAIRTAGVALPCTIVTPMGPLVEVNFDVAGTPYTLPNLIVPTSSPQYIRPPWRKSDMGVVFPSSVSLGAVSGLGSGTPSVTDDLAPMSALTFFPVGNTNWSATAADALVLYSTDDALVQITPAGVNVTGDNGNLSAAGNLAAGSGWTGSFSDVAGNVYSVIDGIIVGGP